jgi:ankyrin repeat protein
LQQINQKLETHQNLIKEVENKSNQEPEKKRDLEIQRKEIPIISVPIKEDKAKEKDAPQVRQKSKKDEFDENLIRGIIESEGINLIQGNQARTGLLNRKLDNIKILEITENGVTPLDYAISLSHLNIVKKLLETNKIDLTQGKPFHRAINCIKERDKRIKVIQLLLEKKAKVQKSDLDGDLLYPLIQQEYSSTGSLSEEAKQEIKLLVENGADVTSSFAYVICNAKFDQEIAELFFKNLKKNIFPLIPKEVINNSEYQSITQYLDFLKEKGVKLD